MKRLALLAVTSGPLVGVAVVVGLAAHDALAAAEDLERAQQRLTVVLEPGTATQEAVSALGRVDRDVTAAMRRLDRWPVDVVTAIPVVGRSWSAERAVALTAHEVIAGARALADSLPQVRASQGGVDLSVLADVHHALAGPSTRSRQAFQRLEDAPLGLTPPQVRRGVLEARASLGPAVRTLEQAGSGLRLMEGLLGGGGRRSVLVVLQNNAELRGSGGYAASFATGHIDAGRLALAPLQDVLDVADPPQAARRVPAPEEYVEDYGRLSGDTTIWRSWNMTPHVPDAAVVGARIAGTLLAEQPDVVVLLDVPALSELVALSGQQVALPDGSIVTPKGLRDALLVDAYAEAGEEVVAQAERRRELQGAATAALTRLLAGQVPLSDAARTLDRLAAQRHVSLWSADPAEQRALVDLGLAGAVVPPPGGDLMHVSVNNVGSNKLDLYVQRDVDVDVLVGERQALVRQRVRFTNEAPEDLVPYVAGTERPGVLVSRVELSLPPGASEVAATVDGGPLKGTLAAGGHRQRLATRLEVPRDGSSVVEVRYAVPVVDGEYRLRLVPQALLRDARLQLRIRAAEGGLLRRATGARLHDGAVSEAGVLSEQRDVTVQRRERVLSRWDRLRQWWNSPVDVG